MSGIRPDRLTLAIFPTGHSVFDGDNNLAKFTEAVRQFVRGGTHALIRRVEPIEAAGTGFTSLHINGSAE